MLTLLLIVELVNTLIGTAPNCTESAGLFGKNTEELGQTLPAVLEPNGMNFWTPQTRDTERKCIAPYYYNDTDFQGFRNSHWIVGGCTQDYGSFTIMPEFEELILEPEKRAISFTHNDEITTPFYYSIRLRAREDAEINAEMTGRSRSAIFRFTYSQAGKGYVVINSNSDEREGNYNTNPVHRIYQGWGEPAGFAGYVFTELSKPATLHIEEFLSYYEFDVEAGEEVLLKVGTSFTSVEAAERNLQSEIGHWDFEQTKEELREIWEQQLGKIVVKTNDLDLKEQFYSALYRASFLPRTMNDVDGAYPAFAGNGEVKRSDTTYYDDFSMWDTFRALHPLITILDPQKSGEMMQSLVDKYEQGGWMPIFPCWNSYTAAMIGDHCAVAIADAYVKGVRNFDVAKAYEGLRKNAFEHPTEAEYKDGKGRRALTSYLKNGYIPLEDEVKEAFHTREQVSRTMEYAFDDFALSQLAKEFGAEDYPSLEQRALNYRNVIDPRTGYAQGRHEDGAFIDNNPFKIDGLKFITEGAACHYTWFAPHDPQGLMTLMGGREAYVAKLDSMFSERRYWHGNEPCHQVAFMYNYADEPAKTQNVVRQILKTEYKNAPGGLSGNDDAGQMSAWYIFAAMGFYPACPATDRYELCGTVFDEVKIGNLTIKGGKETSLNGVPLGRNYITHSELTNGGELIVKEYK